MSGDIAFRIVEILAKRSSVDALHLSPDSNLDEIGLDSVALLECVFEIEEAFEISIPLNSSSSFSFSEAGTVAGIVEMIEPMARNKVA